MKNRAITTSDNHGIQSIADTKNDNAYQKCDSVINMKFNNLSSKYDFNIIDSFRPCSVDAEFCCCNRTIGISSKEGKLLQTLTPEMQYVPWYFFDDSFEIEEKGRSFFTGVNIDAEVVDSYFGDIVIADFNFDSLEDIAIATGDGADNGPHYTFYIQSRSGVFKLNEYLTEEVVWFPSKFDVKAKTFTTVIPAGAYGLGYTTYIYNKGGAGWNIVEKYIIDVATGKRMD